jgi:uncharacterized protein
MSMKSSALDAMNDHEDCNQSNNPRFADIVNQRVNRRSMLRGSTASAGGAVLASFGLAACGGGGTDVPATSATSATPAPAPTAVASTRLEKLSFPPVAKNINDVVTIPTGYRQNVVIALGDPLFAGTAAYKNDGTDTDFDKRSGDHHDGMEYFGLNTAGTAPDPKGSARGILVMNHEALTDQFLHAAGTTANPRPASEADKEIPAHGISVQEVQRGASGNWSYLQASAYNRRITPLTPIELSGPVRGNALVKTLYSTAGTSTRGTINNCGSGYTPWGTYMSGEENWAGYFTRASTDDTTRGGATAKSVVSLRRYGRNAGSGSRHGWETAGTDDKYRRFNIAQTGASIDGTDDYRNELNTYGYMVEVDPYSATSTVKKRTALGRFAHESASFSIPKEGAPLAVYMGDDSRGEYIYKFVSSANWAAADASAANRMATGDKYLDAGKLYVAKYNADGTGQWIELALGNTAIAGFANYSFADQADILVNARLAADAVGATKMDRPEWCTVHPVTGEIYYTLTNNSNRKVEPTGSQLPLDAANPRAYSDSFNGGATGSVGNVNGHIIRMRELGNNPSATSFTWDIYLFGAEASAASNVNLHSLTNDQDFSSPDGLWFSPTTGLLFIQTDDGSYTDVTNCMMLLGKPGSLGDGGNLTVANKKADNSNLNIDTKAGAKPASDNLRRFLVGPVDCEITGCAETPDGKTVFVNIQHPGEGIAKADVGTPSKYLSHWPGNAGYGAGGADARPRSATVAIRKDDGGLIGT